MKSIHLLILYFPQVEQKELLARHHSIPAIQLNYRLYSLQLDKFLLYLYVLHMDLVTRGDQILFYSFIIDK